MAIAVECAIVVVTDSLLRLDLFAFATVAGTS